AATFSTARALAAFCKRHGEVMSERKAILYRMKLPTHECPFGLLAKRMLDDAGFETEEHLLTSREQTDAFKAEHGVATTPQAFINGERIGGSEELARFLESALQD
ncbi:MAG: glutaredoxin domain-containing protein, partial [Sphingomicrobium sp.]